MAEVHGSGAGVSEREKKGRKEGTKKAIRVLWFHFSLKYHFIKHQVLSLVSSLFPFPPFLSFFLPQHRPKFSLPPFRYSEETLSRLAASCDEFLVHGVDVEGKQLGIDDDLVALLGATSPVPVTYAGGARTLVGSISVLFLFC
jgi:hypothetical protein